jgi:putative FmdB family regulatory protein
MPLYEYECFLCGERFERIQKVTAEPISECPFCQGAVRRLLGVPALQFKGTGFYITDYVKKPAPAQSPSEPKTEKKSETKASGETGSAASKDAAKG